MILTYFRFVFTCLAVFSLQTFAQTNPQTRQLLPGQTLERELIGEETHRYEVSLKKGEFFQVQIQQKGIDVALKLIDSKSAVLATMDSPNEDKENETLSFVADSAGNYILEVSGFDKEAGKGNYSIRRETSRTATDDDKKRVAIEKTFVEGLRLRKSKEQEESAIAELEKALKGWEELKDVYLAELTSKQIKILKENSETRENEELNIRPLKIGEVFEIEIKGGDTHYYKIKLKKGEVLQIYLVEKSINARIGVFRVIDKKLINQINLNSGFGHERLTTLIEQEGEYNILVKADNAPPNGSYKMSSNLKEKITDHENEIILAEKLLSEGLVLQNNRTEKTLREALVKWEEALLIWEKQGEDYWIGYTNNLLGLAHNALNEKKKAENYFNKALPSFEKVKNLNGQARSLLNLGSVTDDLGSQEKALGYYYKALPLFETIGDISGQATVTNNVGFIYSVSGEFEKALDYLNQALKNFEKIKNLRGQARTINNIGLIYVRLSERQKALDYYQKALPILDEINDSEAKASTLNNIGSIYDDWGYKKLSLQYYEETLKIVKNPKGRAITLSNIGKVLVDLNDNQKALDILNQASLLFEKNEDFSGKATTLIIAGSVHSNMGENQKALNLYTEALSLVEQSNNFKVQATGLNNIGRVFDDLGEKQKALDYYNKSLTFRDKINDFQGRADTLNNMGKVYDDLGENRKALNAYVEALEIYEKSEDFDGLAITLSNIGSVYSNIGENQKALNFYDQALSLSEKYDNFRGQATALNNKGKIYDDLGENRKALEFYKRALKLVEKIDYTQGRANTLNNMGLSYSALGEKQNALDHFNKSLQLSTQIGDSSGQATSFNNIGAFYGRTGEKQKALEFFNKALVLVKKIGDKANEAGTLNNLGNLYKDLGQKQKSFEFFNQSLRLSSTIGKINDKAASFSNLMFLLESQKRNDLAVIYGKQSINLYQELRYFIEKSPKGTQRVFLKSIEDTYRFLAEILLAEKRVAEAVQILEILKKEEAFSFEGIDGNQLNTLKQTSKLTPNEAVYLDKIEKYFSKISPPISTLAELRQMQEQGINLSDGQKSELEALTVETEKIEKDFASNMQTFADEFNKNLAGRATDFQLPIQNDLAQYGKDTAFVYTLVGEERYRIILVTENRLESQSFDIKRSNLNEKIESFRSDLQNKDVDPREAGQELYEILINKPIGKELRELKAKTLLWSLDGKLRLIPVAALWTGEKYFGQEYQNVNVTVSDRSPLNESVSREWNVLGAGTSETQNVKLSDNKSKSFDGLKYVQNELVGIVKENEIESGLLAGKRLYNASFTAATLNKELNGKYKVIHFASHFALNAGNMDDSYLVLGDGNILTVRDIRNNENNKLLDTELFVLSACETGVTGKDSNGIEIEGFAYIAQEQGADAILSSLWKVADESTSLFMKEFYRMRKANSNLTKTEIIQKIQEKMMLGEIKGSISAVRTGDDKESDKTVPTPSKRFKFKAEKPYEHPYYWAPFVLIGNWR